MMSGPHPKACPLFFGRFTEMLHRLQLHKLVLIYLFIPKFPDFVIPYSEFAVFFLIRSREPHWCLQSEISKKALRK